MYREKRHIDDTARRRGVGEVLQPALLTQWILFLQIGPIYYLAGMPDLSITVCGLSPGGGSQSVPRSIVCAMNPPPSCTTLRPQAV
jgi:hypothetical protein